MFEHHLDASRENPSLKSLWQWEMGSLLCSMWSPLWWQLLAHWQVQLRSWSPWLCPAGVTCSWENVVERVQVSIATFPSYPFRLFKDKGLLGEYKNSWTPGLSGLGVFCTSWILSARNVSSLASIQLCRTSSQPSVLPQSLNWTWRGSENHSTHRPQQISIWSFFSLGLWKKPHLPTTNLGTHEKLIPKAVLEAWS